MKNLPLLLSLLVALATARPAHADKPETERDPTAAEAAFREGRAHMRAGRHAQACDKFALSQRLDPGVGALLNLGLCHQARGDLASAWTELNQAADMASRAREAHRAKKIRARARALAPRLVRLQVRVAGKHPEGLRVTRNRKDVTESLGSAIPVDPADYLIEATADGMKPWRQRVRAEGEGATITVDIPALDAIVGPESTDSSAAAGGLDRPELQASSATASPGKTRRRIALGLGVAGLATSATGVFFGIRARAQWKRAQLSCSDDLCRAERNAQVDRAKTSANGSSLLVGVGVVALIGGGVLWFTAPRGRAMHERRTQLVPVVGPGRATLSLTGQF